MTSALMATVCRFKMALRSLPAGPSAHIGRVPMRTVSSAELVAESCSRMIIAPIRFSRRAT
jgi:hypothetical protein